MGVLEVFKWFNLYQIAQSITDDHVNWTIFEQKWSSRKSQLTQIKPNSTEFKILRIVSWKIN